MFNATDLLRQWNKSKGLTGRKGKRIDDFLKTSNAERFLEELEKDILNTENNRYLKTHETARGKNGGTFMHPFLFIKFAMWLNPRFELEVINKIHYLCC